VAAKLAEAFTGNTESEAVDAKLEDFKQYKVHKNSEQSFSAYLMCADIKNNNNKFYICQLLEQDGDFYFWTRYGRVGDNGVSELNNVYDISQAEKDFNKKVREKVRKGYEVLKMNLGEKNDKKDDKEDAKKF
jgi:poly [ADP-ribose] polymerase